MDGVPNPPYVYLFYALTACLLPSNFHLPFICSYFLPFSLSASISYTVAPETYLLTYLRARKTKEGAAAVAARTTVKCEREVQ